MTTDERIDQLFALLTEWRRFPNYQLERRADIFFALYLRDILRHCYPGNDFDLIIPEFPLRYGSIRDKDQGNSSNLSAKVDYVCVDRNNKFCVLLELKTEERSLSKAQFENMENALRKDYEMLTNGVRELLMHTKEKSKYTTLLNYLDTPLTADHGRAASGTPESGMKLAIIKPTANRDACPKDCKVISFEDVATILNQLPNTGDGLTLSFLKALKDWKEPLGH
jgi:hypothetical protein